MRLAIRSALAAATLVVGAAAAAHAQADSVFAVSSGGNSLLRLNTDAALVARGAVDQGSIPASGAGVRMMWFPARFAFRAGQLIADNTGNGTGNWDAGNIGYGSVAFGKNTVASGNYSAAIGINSEATGLRSFAVSGFARAEGAMAIGSFSQAEAREALALGSHSRARAVGGIAIGTDTDVKGDYGLAIGHQSSASGQHSLTLGKNARAASFRGVVVLGDACASFSSDSVYPNANKQFVARGCGGIRFFTNQNLTSGVEVAAGGGSWSSISDRNRKENFLALDGESVLTRLRAVPVMTWNYKSQDRSIRHIGPTAQDLYAAFGVGESNLLINTVDIDGINLAAAKELEARTAAQETRIRTLEAENAELRTRLERLEALIGGRRNRR